MAPKILNNLKSCRKCGNVTRWGDHDYECNRSGCPVYYRIFNRSGRLIVCCLQDFDEFDYDATERVDENKYDTEELAEEVAEAYKMATMAPFMGITPSKLRRIADILEEED